MCEIAKVFSQTKSVIVLDAPFVWDPFIPFLRPHPCLIAADGAVKLFEKQNIEPHYVVGDGDSCNIHKKRLCYHINKEQDTTDFQKAFAFAKKKKKTPTLVLGVNCGEFDHVLGNIYILLQEASKQCFLDAQKKGEKILVKMGVSLSNDTWSFQSPIGTTVSFFPFPTMVCTTQGLQWPLQNSVLSLNGSFSLRNRTCCETWQVGVVGKGLVVFDLYEM